MNSTLTLYLEINNSNYVFFVGESDEQNNIKIVSNNFPNLKLYTYITGKV